MSIELEQKLHRVLAELAEDAPVPRSWDATLAGGDSRADQFSANDSDGLLALQPELEVQPPRRWAPSIAVGLALAAVVALGLVLDIRSGHHSTVQSAATEPSTSMTQPASGASLDVASLSKIASSIGEGSSIAGSRPSHARAVASNLAAAKALENESPDTGDSDQPVIVLQVEGHFSIMVNPDVPAAGTSAIAILNPQTLQVKGYFLTNHPGDLSQLGEVVDIPLD